MKIEDQCISLELAKKLKELGIKQESLWTWLIAVKDKEKSGPIIILSQGQEQYSETEVCDGWKLTGWSAFTVSELGLMLPTMTTTIRNHISKLWVAAFETPGPLSGFNIFEENEVNARAKILIYLLEKGFILNDTDSSTKKRGNNG